MPVVPCMPLHALLVTSAGGFVVRWVIQDGALGEALFFTGLNFSGQRLRVRFFPGGRMQGDDIDGTDIKSFGIIGNYGMRVTLCTARSDIDWEEATWRSVTLLEGTTFESQSGKPAVQVPDLDVIDPFEARRTDLDNRKGYPFAKDQASGEGWTFGNATTSELKCNVRTIRVDNIFLKTHTPDEPAE
jgi:hypothetical protein